MTKPDDRHECATMGRCWLLARIGAGLGLAFAGLVGCAADSMETSGADESGAAGGAGFPGSGGSAGSFAGTGGGAGGQPPPPEQEVESSFRTPVATSRFVWTANPESGRVALVDALSLAVRVEDAGFGPTEIAAVPDPDDPSSDVAIVLNALSHDATLFRVRGTDAPQKTTLKTHAGANAWVVSPKGRWAVAWTDATRVQKPDPTDGFQEITVVSLSEGSERSTRLSVGYRPVDSRVRRGRNPAVRGDGAGNLGGHARPSARARSRPVDRGHRRSAGRPGFARRPDHSRREPRARPARGQGGCGRGAARQRSAHERAALRRAHRFSISARTARSRSP